MRFDKDEIIDRLAGLPFEFTEEIAKLKLEVFDSNGIEIMPDNHADVKEAIQKANRYSQLLSKRNTFWKATMN
jgi:predicted Fe-Mo cluster-binding NifX family protein